MNIWGGCSLRGWDPGTPSRHSLGLDPPQLGSGMSTRLPHTVLSYSRCFTLESRCEKKPLLPRGSDSAQGWIHICRDQFLVGGMPRLPVEFQAWRQHSCNIPATAAESHLSHVHTGSFPYFLQAHGSNPCPPVLHPARGISCWERVLSCWRYSFVSCLLCVQGGTACVGWIETRCCAAGGKI